MLDTYLNLPERLAVNYHNHALQRGEPLRDLIGQTIGNFVLDAVLFSDHMGRVYRARRPNRSEMAMVRVLEVDLKSDTGFPLRFASLAEKIKALEHPNVAKLIDYGEITERFYVTTEFVQDGSARTLLQHQAKLNQPLDLLLAIDLVRQAADALEYARIHSVMHGEIKPDNLLLMRQVGGSDSYQVKVNDFGLARLDAEFISDGASSNALSSAPAYISPEHWGALEAPDHRADIYSLGVVLYELATGVQPFVAPTMMEIANQHLRITARAPSEVGLNLPIGLSINHANEVKANLDTIVLKCLRKRADERYATSGELSNALRALLDSLGINPITVIVPPPLILPAPHVPPLRVRPERTSLRVLDQNGRPVAVLDRLTNQMVESLEIGSDGLRVGRREAPHNDVVLNDDTISRHHLRLDLDQNPKTKEEFVTITDLNSSNGTYLSNISDKSTERLPPMVPVPLRDWDRMLRVGSYWLRLEKPIEINKPTIGVSLDHETLTLTPGQPVMLMLTLANQGTLVDHYAISFEGESLEGDPKSKVVPSWIKLPDPGPRRQGVQLNPGESTKVPVAVTAPRRGDVRDGTYAVTVLVSSIDDTNQSVRVQATWVVMPFAYSLISLSPSKASGLTGASFEVQVRNEGNFPVRYEFTAEDEERFLRFQFGSKSAAGTVVDSKQGLTVEPGMSQQLPLRLNAKQRVFGLTQQRSFTVRAESKSLPEPSPEGNTPNTPEARRVLERHKLIAEARLAGLAQIKVQPIIGQFGHRTLIPPWLPPAILGLFIVIAIVVFNALKPTITSFTLKDAAKRPVMVSEATTVVWEGRNIQKLEFRPDVPAFDARDIKYRCPGETDNINKGCFTFLKGFAKDTPLEAVASGILGLQSKDSLLIAPKQQAVADPVLVFHTNTQQEKATIAPGGSVKLEWKVENADSVRLEPFGDIGKGYYGLKVVTPETPKDVETAITYRMTATNKLGKSISKSVLVTVKPQANPPAQILSFVVSPNTITAGQSASVQLSWTTKDAMNVTINGLPVGQNGANVAQPAPAATTDYILIAKNKDGIEVNKFARLNVKPAPTPPTPIPPKQDPPKQDPPKQDPPKQDPPKQDPPKPVVLPTEVLDFKVDKLEITQGETIKIDWNIKSTSIKNISLIYKRQDGTEDDLNIKGLKGQTFYTPITNGTLKLVVLGKKDANGESIPIGKPLVIKVNP